MALADEVTTRYSARLMRNLTNPDDADATANDTARLALAVTDVEAAFLTYAQATYDGTNSQHVEAGVMGVIAYLQDRGGTGPIVSEETIESFRDRLKDMRKTGAGKRITPKGSGAYNPSDPPTGVPPFDTRQFEEVAPIAPHTGDP